MEVANHQARFWSSDFMVIRARNHGTHHGPITHATHPRNTMMISGSRCSTMFHPFVDCRGPKIALLLFSTTISMTEKQRQRPPLSPPKASRALPGRGSGPGEDLRLREGAEKSPKRSMRQTWHPTCYTALRCSKSVLTTCFNRFKQIQDKQIQPMRCPKSEVLLYINMLSNRCNINEQSIVIHHLAPQPPFHSIGVQGNELQTRRKTPKTETREKT